ncbi:MAG: diguanylate cyclase [Nitrospiraceae bacterium]|nr:diguanylate cyclase [Nitrospiraceae bacterium]
MQPKKNLLEKFNSSNPWNLVWLSVVAAEIVAALLDSAISLSALGRLNAGLLIAGALDALVIASVISSVVVYFVLKEQRRTENALRRSSNFLNDIIHSIQDPFSIFSSDYRMIKVNHEYAALKNRSIDELTGAAKCYEIAGQTEVCENCVVQKTFLSSNPCAKEKLLLLPDGTPHWVEIYTYPILDASSQVSHVIEYMRDVTDRKVSEEEKQQLIEKLEQLSKTDELTSVLNKRAIMERLDYEMDRARRYLLPLSLIICDVDHFKQINDTLGHAAGDKVLRVTAQTLAGVLRKPDIIGRFGGDEFLLILPQTPLEGAAEFAERLRQNVQDIIYPGMEVKTTMSIGIASYQGNPDPNDIIRRADIALYSAKKAGRNKISF